MAHWATQSLAVIALNLVIAGALLIGARVAMIWVDRSMDVAHWGWDLSGLVNAGTLLLCVPPGLAIWRALRSFLETIVERVSQQEGLRSCSANPI